MEVRVDRLCKAYDGKPVLRNISLTLTPGVTCVMAPSGGGKTTLLRLLMGLERPDAGSVAAPAGARWAAVFQEDRLLPWLDAAGNLRFALSGWDPARAASLLSELNISLADPKPVGEYSGGMRRRLALARALLAPSDLLALDEPFTGLDAENRGLARECLLRETAGKPVVLATHDPGDAEALGARVISL